MQSLLAFVLALGLLIAIHEYGHYRMAVACGVKVLRFSIGFGRPVFQWRLAGKPTEFVVGWIPLGGYVRMLDEREGPVEAAELHVAFNRQPLAARAAIVAAGPLANLLLAVALHAGVQAWGQHQARPILATPSQGSLAERAGLRAGDVVLEASLEGEVPQKVRSFAELRWQLTRAGLDGERLHLLVQSGADRPAARDVVLELADLSDQEPDAQWFAQLGISAPFNLPVLGELQPDGAAEQAGLKTQDRVLAVDGRTVADAAQLRAMIRQSSAGRAQVWDIERAGQRLSLVVTPRAGPDGAPRIGAYLGGPPATVFVREAPLEALAQGVDRTWELSTLTLKMLGRMLIGEASLSHLSGPLTLADQAGRSAQMGATSFLLFLALISVSLGVLNLLPLPLLDGGHLMYYLYELITGRSVPEPWVDRLQRAGIVILGVLMVLALFNDVVRLFG